MTSIFKSAGKILAALMLVATPAAADTFPERPIEIIVTYDAGGMTDTLARLIAEFMPRYLPGEPDVIIVNKPGGAGTIGMTMAAEAEPDGYTLVYTTSSPITIQPHYGKTPFTPDDFVPVAKVFEVAAAMNVHKDSDMQTLDDLIAFARENPGQFTFSSTGGVGSGTHIVSEEFARAAGIEIRHIPFEGTAQQTAALSGRQIMGAMRMPDLHRGGDARPLVFLSNSKPQSDFYKDVPTARDLGYDVSADFFGGVFAPAGTPADRVALISEAIEKALAEPEVIDMFTQFEIPLVYEGPERFGAIVAQAYAQNGAMMKELGLID